MSSTRQTLLRFCFLALVLYATLFFKLGEMALVGADEPRYAQVAEEMFHSGDFVVPTLHGAPWLEKPPLYYWLAAASYRIIGVNETAARLPSAAAAAISILLMWWLIGRLRGRDTAFLAALMGASTPLLFVFSRAASTDALFSACLACGILLGFYALATDSWWPYPLAGAAIGLAALAKGPVGPLLVLMAALPVLVLHPSAGRFKGMLAAAAACACVALPWYVLILQRASYEFLSVFVLNHHLARFFTTLHHHEQPFYYYAVILAGGLYPWSIVAVCGHPSRGLAGIAGLRPSGSGPGASRGRHDARRARSAPPLAHPCGTVVGGSGQPGGSILETATQWGRSPALLFLAGSITAPLLLFSASSSKLPAYILPAIVPLIVAITLILPLQAQVPEWRRFRAVSILLIVCSAALTAALALTMGRAYQAAGLGLAGGAILTGGAVLAAWLGRRSLPTGLVALAGSNVLLALFLAAAAAPVIEPYHSSRSVIQQALPRLKNEKLHPYRTFHHTIDYYSGSHSAGESIDSFDQLLKRVNERGSLWLITPSSEAARLKQETQLRVETVATRGTWVVIRVSRSG